MTDCLGLLFKSPVALMKQERQSLKDSVVESLATVVRSPVFIEVFRGKKMLFSLTVPSSQRLVPLLVCVCIVLPHSSILL